MTKKVAQKVLVVAILMIAAIWPHATLLAATDLPIGSPCKDNSDCRSNDCETSEKKDASNNNLRFCDCNDAGDCQQQYGAPASGVWKCVDGASVTADLDYCINEANNRIESTLPEYETNTSLMGRLHTALFDTKALQATLMQEVMTFKPGLEIRLPGLEFSDLAKKVDEEGFLHIPWIGEFLKAIYNFGLAIISIVAVVMIIMQGAKIIVSGGESKVEGYKKIGQIAIGLMIAWGSYAILYTINPALVQFNSLKVKYIEKKPLTLEFLSNESYQKITGNAVMSKSDSFQKAKEMSAAAGFDPCVMQAILLTESGGNPAVIGHDENAGVAKPIPARREFLLSGKKYSGATFDPSPGTSNNFDVNENKRKIWNDDGGKNLNTAVGPPDYGLDWRFTHGFGLGQITITGKEYCSPGVRGAKRCGKCYTIPELLSPQSSIEISICLMKKNIEKAKSKGWKSEDDIIRAAFWGFATGPGNIPNPSSGSEILYGKKADGTRKPGDTKWEPYKQCKSNPTIPKESTPDPEDPKEADPEQS